LISLARNPGSIPSKDKTFPSSAKRPNGFWGPPSLLFIGRWGASSPRVEQPGCEATTHHLLPRFRIPRSVLHFTLRTGRTSLLPT